MTETTQTSKFKKGDIVKFASPRKRRQYKVVNVNYWNNKASYELRAIGGSLRGSYASNILDTDIVLASAPKTVAVDKNGKTSSEYAKEVFPVGDYAKADYYYTTRETIVKIEKITKTQIKVRECHGGRINVRGPLNQEYYEIDTDKLEVTDRVYTFSANLHSGEWGFWSGDRSLKKFDGQVEWLLD